MGGKRPQALGADLEDATQLSFGEASPQLHDGGIEALHVSDAQHPAGGRGGVHHRLRLSAIGGDRLLHQHVRTGAQGGDRQLAVQRGRRGNADQVELLGGQHGQRVGVAAAAGGLGGARQDVGPRIGGGHELDAGQRRPDAGVVLAHAAQADDAGAQCGTAAVGGHAPPARRPSRRSRAATIRSAACPSP